MPANSASAAVPTQKQRFNIYTMMLVLSFIAICTACTLLYLEVASFVDEGAPFTSAWDAQKAKYTPKPLPAEAN